MESLKQDYENGQKHMEEEARKEEEARAAADAHHVEYEERHKKGDILNLFFEEFVEEHLMKTMRNIIVNSEKPY